METDPQSPQVCDMTVDGVAVLGNPRRTIFAALRSVSFLNYLGTNRQWPEEALLSFSTERWAHRVAWMRTAANTTVLGKLLVGWLATQSVLLKRGFVEYRPFFLHPYDVIIKKNFSFSANEIVP